MNQNLRSTIKGNTAPIMLRILQFIAIVLLNYVVSFCEMAQLRPSRFQNMPQILGRYFLISNILLPLLRG